MNIYVGNLSFQCEENELQSLFEKYGEVSSVKIIKDNFTGRSKGFGFIIMDNQEEANEAIENLNEYAMGGRNITVNEAKPRAERPAGGSGGGGSRGGYGGGGNSGGGYGGGGNSGGGGRNSRW